MEFNGFILTAYDYPRKCLGINRVDINCVAYQLIKQNR